MSRENVYKVRLLWMKSAFFMVKYFKKWLVQFLMPFCKNSIISSCQIITGSIVNKSIKVYRLAMRARKKTIMKRWTTTSWSPIRAMCLTNLIGGVQTLILGYAHAFNKHNVRRPGDSFGMTQTCYIITYDTWASLCANLSRHSTN